MSSPIGLRTPNRPANNLHETITIEYHLEQETREVTQSLTPVLVYEIRP